jgi:hypothetical protein
MKVAAETPSDNVSHDQQHPTPMRGAAKESTTTREPTILPDCDSGVPGTPQHRQGLLLSGCKQRASHHPLCHWIRPWPATFMYTVQEAPTIKVHQDLGAKRTLAPQICRMQHIQNPTAVQTRSRLSRCRPPSSAAATHAPNSRLSQLQQQLRCLQVPLCSMRRSGTADMHVAERVHRGANALPVAGVWWNSRGSGVGHRSCLPVSTERGHSHLWRSLQLRRLQ